MKTVKQVKEELKQAGLNYGMIDLGLIEEAGKRVSTSIVDSSPHHRLFLLWDEGFMARFGYRYVFMAKDGLAVKRILAIPRTPEEFMDMAKAAWAVESERPFWHCFHMSRSLTKFYSAINEIGAELSRMKPEKETDYTHF